MLDHTAYLNAGTKAEPKFSHAEIVPIYPPRVAKDEKLAGNCGLGP